MIRPFTLLCMLLAAGSGLYLYQAKQRARVLDRQIEDIRSQTAATHQRAEVLRAEYTLLNDPTRLAGLAATYLPDLKPTQPQQWSSMAELDKRLPPVGEATATPAPLEPASPDTAAPAALDGSVPVATATPKAADTPHAAAVAHAEPARVAPVVTVAELPRPAPAAVRTPRPAAIAHAAAARPVEARPVEALAREPVIAARRVTPRIVAERLPPPTRAQSRASRPNVPAPYVVATQRPAPPQPPAEPPATPMVASALGMARTMLAPVTPANAATVAPERDGVAR